MVTYVPPCKELLIYVLALPLQPQPEHITEEGKRSARAILTEREGRVGPSVNDTVVNSRKILGEDYTCSKSSQ